MKRDCMRQMNRLALCIAILGGVLVGCSDKEDDMAMCINDTTLRLSDRETPVLCAIACVDGSCVPCKNGAVECRDGAIYTCVDDAWKKYKDCPSGCDGNTCGLYRVCATGAQKCDENAEFVCKNDPWEKVADCPYGCNDAECKACDEGTRECREDAEYMCLSGKWQLAQTCEKGCASGQCTVCQSDASLCKDGIR